MENVFRKIYIGINRAKVSKVENKGQVRKNKANFGYLSTSLNFFSDFNPL